MQKFFLSEFFVLDENFSSNFFLKTSLSIYSFFFEKFKSQNDKKLPKKEILIWSENRPYGRQVTGDRKLASPVGAGQARAAGGKPRCRAGRARRWAGHGLGATTCRGLRAGSCCAIWGNGR